MIEMTLTDNHMLGVLAQNGSQIASPAQLLPLLIGALSFLRVLWLIFREWREEHLNHSEDDPEHKHIMRLIPEIKRRKTSEESALHKRKLQGRHLLFKNRYARYTLTWMPWLAELMTRKSAIPHDEEAKPDLTKNEKVLPTVEEEQKPTGELD
jgi:hypothetical protein